MKKPFDEKALPLDLRKHYKENKNAPANTLAYLQEYGHDGQSENMHLALFISYIEVECATTIYVDEVGAALHKARARLERFSAEPTAALFLKELGKLERLDKRRRNRLDKLLAMDFATLDLRDKKNVAYELADSKDAEHQALAALYFLKLYDETNDLHLFCNYAATLYHSGQKKEALQAYEKIEQLFKTEIYPDKGWVMMTIHADRMDFYREDRQAFRKHWDAAQADPYLQEISGDFPGYVGYVTDFAEVSLHYGYTDICDKLFFLMKKEKLPLPPTVKAHYAR